MADSIEFTTGRGRLVGGSLFKENTKDMEGKPLTDKAGNPRSEYILQVAFPKSDPLTTQLIDVINRAASASGLGVSFPGNQGNFSFKVKDGDSTEIMQSGHAPASKEGWPGHYVVTFKSGFAFGKFRIHGGQYVPLAENEVKTGDYVKISASFAFNENRKKPGVYANIHGVLLEAAGEPIMSAAANPAAMFGSVPGAPVATPTPAPVPAVAPVPTPVPPPNPAILQPPVPTGPQFTPAGQALGATYEALIGAGWNDELLRANGYIV